MSDSSSADRLAELYAGCVFGYASQDDLFTALLEARSKLRGVKSESPADAFLAGFAQRAALQGLPNSRRAEVCGALTEWLPLVLGLSDHEVRFTLQMWATRAKAARKQAADRDKRVRA